MDNEKVYRVSYTDSTTPKMIKATTEALALMLAPNRDKVWAATEVK